MVAAQSETIDELRRESARVIEQAAQEFLAAVDAEDVDDDDTRWALHWAACRFVITAAEVGAVVDEKRYLFAPLANLAARIYPIEKRLGDQYALDPEERTPPLAIPYGITLDELGRRQREDRWYTDAITGLVTALRNPPAPPREPETFQRLVEQEVPREQICRILGLFDQFGNLQWGLFKELENDPQKAAGIGYTAPIVEKRLAEQRALEQADFATLGDRVLNLLCLGYSHHYFQQA